MHENQEKITEHLSSIIEKNLDAVKGYDKAVEHAEDLHLIQFFKRKSKERQSFLDELRQDARQHGINDINDTDGSVAGTLHRGWMDVKAFFSGDDEEAMLEEALKGDKAAVDEYEDILEENILPDTTATLLRDQVVKIRKDLTQINKLEDLR